MGSRNGLLAVGLAVGAAVGLTGGYLANKGDSHGDQVSPADMHTLSLVTPEDQSLTQPVAGDGGREFNYQMNGSTSAGSKLLLRFTVDCADTSQSADYVVGNGKEVGPVKVQCGTATRVAVDIPKANSVYDGDALRVRGKAAKSTHWIFAAEVVR
jgi:hypothetical protein